MKKVRVRGRVAVAMGLMLSVVTADSLGEADQLRSRSTRMLVRLGDRLMQASRESVGHDFSDAKGFYRQALNLSPKEPEALVGMAWVRNSEHAFEAGAEWATQALEVDPENLHAYALLADGAMELGEYDDAFGYVQKALDIRSDLSTLSRAGHLLWLTGEPVRAKELMQLAIRSGGPFPENIAWCRSELALMHFHEGEMIKAREQAMMAYGLAPKNPRVLNMMGRIYEAEGNLDEAIAFYEKSAAVTPLHESMAKLVSLYLETGDGTKAQRQIQKVMKLHQGHQHDHGSEAEHEHAGGSAEVARFMADHEIDIRGAVHEAEHAYGSFPNVRSADALGWCYFKSGNLDDALRMSNEALEWETPLAEFHFHHGMILAALGRNSESKGAFERALEMNPKFDRKDSKTARLALERLGYEMNPH